MEDLREYVRKIILVIKSREERQKKKREKLTNVYRTIQKYPVFKTSYFTSYTKQILSGIKEADGQNKCFKEDLRGLLIKIDNLRRNVGPGTKKDFSPEILVGIIEKQQKQTISSEYESNIELRKIQTYDTDNLMSTISTTSDIKLTSRESSINFENSSMTKFNKFTGKRNNIQMGVELKKDLFKKITEFESPIWNFERVVYILTFFYTWLKYFKLPELKKIKCKIKRKL